MKNLHLALYVQVELLYLIIFFLNKIKNERAGLFYTITRIICLKK